MAEHFARHGARVAVLDLKQPWAQATADEIVAYGGIAHALDETIVR
jgi:NAD(P)-dependent dehydrogenase (short-subunit alcohol dehydrogenase family)